MLRFVVLALAGVGLTVIVGIAWAWATPPNRPAKTPQWTVG